MRGVLAGAAAAALLVSSAAVAQSWPDVAGSWDTTQGVLILSVTDVKDAAGTVIGKAVKGPYRSEAGNVAGELQGNTLVGYWHEPHSSVKCPTKRGGTFYWGKISFAFDAAAKEYSGTWGYCDEVPERGWSGRRAAPAA
jgi:hypothetical protein